MTNADVVPSRDYSDVTETGGTQVSPEAIDMVRTRYEFAARLAEGKDVLEVACGPGPGLGMLASRARRLVAGDYTAALLADARRHFGPGMRLVRLDATSLPFTPGSFDVVILFEAVYFLPDVPAFLAECRRVLRDGGILILVSVNPAWVDFHPNHAATRYWLPRELDQLLQSQGFATQWFGAFPAVRRGLRGRVLGWAKKMAVRFDLLPKTMKGKEWLKRIAFGTLVPFPVEVTEHTGSDCPPVPLAAPDAAGNAGFKVVYAVGRING